MKKLAILATVVAAIFFTSCRKNGMDVMVGPNGQIYVTFHFNQSGQYPYYPQGYWGQGQYIPRGVTVVRYITAQPAMISHISVVDANGIPSGDANCTVPEWYQYMLHFNYATGKIPVLYYSNGDGSGTITAM